MRLTTSPLSKRYRDMCAWVRARAPLSPSLSLFSLSSLPLPLPVSLSVSVSMPCACAVGLMHCNVQVVVPQEKDAQLVLLTGVPIDEPIANQVCTLCHVSLAPCNHRSSRALEWHCMSGAREELAPSPTRPAPYAHVQVTT